MRSWCQQAFQRIPLVWMVISTGCFATANREALQRGIAPEKLQCDEKQITMTPFAGETRIFTGCGRASTAVITAGVASGLGTS